MKIVFFEIEDWEKEILQKHFIEHDVQFFSDPLTEDTVGAAVDADVISIFIYSQATAVLLSKLTKLKLITTRSTGVDHIDMNYCRSKFIEIANVPVYGEHTVAEHTFGLVLALSRNLIESVERTRRGSFSNDGLRGYELFGKTIGIVGAGAIGREVIKIAHGFGMKILVHNRTIRQDLIEKYGCIFVPFEIILKESDIISFHVPDCDDTHHMLNRITIQLCKKNAIIINTSRGGVIETEALVWALENNVIQGAALDVLEVEHGLKEERQLVSREFHKNSDAQTQLLNLVILRRDDVIVTPHNAFNSVEGLETILDSTVNTIELFLHKNANA